MWSLPPGKLPPKPDPGGGDEIMDRAEARVSEEDREICKRMSFSLKPCEEITEREWEAVAAFDCAIKLECTRAGYGSMTSSCLLMWGASEGRRPTPRPA